jgi:cytochrome oxidase Cu insertion factor (SCO1/SenC/PrrC family)
MQQGKQQPVVEGRREGGVAARPRIPDVEVLDQNGRKLRFYSDLIKGKTVAVNFIFTTCTYVCPMQGGSFSKLQLALGDRLGKDVHLISVSTDPSKDTPERLKAWGARYGVRPGWTLVTGGKPEIDQLLRELTGEPAGTGKHAPAALIGDFDKGQWSGIYGLAEPERYLATFARLANGSAAKPPAKQ